MPNLDLIKTFQFEAAHHSGYAGDSERLHGHSYKVDLIVEGELDSALGWVMDYADISKAFAPIYHQLDHQCLNDIEGIEDTQLDSLGNWILEHTKLRIPMLKDIHVEITGDCSFTPIDIVQTASPNMPNRIRFGFEAAHALPNLPPDHKCRAMHGHSFLVEVAAKNIETLVPNLRTLFDILDHQCLNELEELTNPTSEVLSIWIWNKLTETRDDITAVLVAETCTARCIYRGQ